jgi:hypothetical protein
MTTRRSRRRFWCCRPTCSSSFRRASGRDARHARSTLRTRRADASLSLCVSLPSLHTQDQRSLRLRRARLLHGYACAPDGDADEGVGAALGGRHAVSLRHRHDDAAPDIVLALHTRDAALAWRAALAAATGGAATEAEDAAPPAAAQNVEEATTTTHDAADAAAARADAAAAAARAEAAEASAAEARRRCVFLAAQVALAQDAAEDAETATAAARADADAAAAHAAQLAAQLRDARAEAAALRSQQQQAASKPASQTAAATADGAGREPSLLESHAAATAAAMAAAAAAMPSRSRAGPPPPVARSAADATDREKGSSYGRGDGSATPPRAPRKPRAAWPAEGRTEAGSTRRTLF